MPARPVIYISIGAPPTTPNSFYITTCFLNTNKTNFSNVAERLTEGTIRFVLHTNLSVLHECNGCRGHCQHLCNSWWKKENTLSSIRKIRNIRV